MVQVTQRKTWRYTPSFPIAVTLIALFSVSAELTSAQSIVEPTAGGDADTILAYVGDQAITVADVDLQLGRAAASSGATNELSPEIQGTTVHLIALQRQALLTLQATKQVVPPAELDKWFAENPLSEEQRITPGEASIRGLIAFRLSWQPYLAKHMTKKNVERHFSNQRRRFNGTLFDITIASIATPPGESKRRHAATKRLIELRQSIAERGDELATATSQQSVIDVRELAQVQGSGKLHPRIVDAILELKPDEWSQPVHSPLGVHLIYLASATEGNRELDEVEGEVRAHMLYFLLEHLAAKSAEKYPLRSAQ